MEIFYEIWYSSVVSWDSFCRVKYWLQKISDTMLVKKQCMNRQVNNECKFPTIPNLYANSKKRTDTLTGTNNFLNIKSKIRMLV